MNINEIFVKSPIRSKIVVRLWMIMMIMIVLNIAFMWVVQIFLFEQNYLESKVAEVQNNLQPFIQDLETKDLENNDQLLLSISKTINGKMILIDGDGKMIAGYSMGHKILDENSLHSMSQSLNYIDQSNEYKQLLNGKSYNKIIRYDSEPIVLEIGMQVIYDNRHASIILYQTLDQLHIVLDINRKQLVLLSIILTIAASILAAFLSRYFVKPIYIIKCAVDRLAKGDLTATPEISLYDEFGQLSDSVKELSLALQRVDILRKEVIANVSHELRSPLAVISGYTEMVRDINWKDDEKRNENLNLILQEAGRLSDMVNDIMDYSQFQSGYIKLKVDRYNLYEIVESEIAHCEQNASEYDIRIQLVSEQTEIQVEVDAMKISQVMRNLLNNAVNHTVDGETINVVIEKLKSKIKVSVINPGKPISKEERKIIWERYQRCQHHGGRNKGTGIGLSIVSTFLKAHNMLYGVECENSLTTFWFEYSSDSNMLESRQLTN